MGAANRNFLMITNKLRHIAAFIFAVVCNVSVSGQDLLANQAPIDRKMKAVDSVALNRIMQAEQSESPAAALYEDWDNRYAHKATALPDSFRIDLRHFHMPTPSRIITSNFGS